MFDQFEGPCFLCHATSEVGIARADNLDGNSYAGALVHRLKDLRHGTLAKQAT